MLGLITYQPNHMKESTTWFDKELQREVGDIKVGGGPFFEDLHWRMTSLPIRVG